MEKQMLVQILSNQRIIVEQLNSIIAYIAEKEGMGIEDGKTVHYFEEGDLNELEGIDK